MFNQEKKELKSDIKKKELEQILSSQRRHPILDRLMMLIGIGGLFFISIPFMFIGGLLVGNGSIIKGICSVFLEYAGRRDVPIFLIPWSQASWIFVAIGLIMVISIAIGLLILFIIYARDFVTIIKSISILLRKNVENTIDVVREQTEDTKKIALGTPVLPEEPKKPAKKTKSSKKKEDEDVVAFEKKIEQIKKELENETKVENDKIEDATKEISEPNQAEVKTEEPKIDLTNLVDGELDKLLGAK